MIFRSTLRKLQATNKPVWQVDIAAFTAVVGYHRAEVIASVDYFSSHDAAKHHAATRDGTSYGATSKPVITKIAATSLDLSTFW